MEQRWTTAVRVFLDLVNGGTWLCEFLNPPFSFAKGVII